MVIFPPRTALCRSRLGAWGLLRLGMNGQQAISQWEQQTHFRATGVAATLLAYQPILLVQTVVRYHDRKASVYTARNYDYHVHDMQRAGLIS